MTYHVIIPTHRGGKHLRACLDCLADAACDLGPNLRVTVVYDGCDEPAPTSNLRVSFVRGNFGSAAKARNYGLWFVIFEYIVVFLDDDNLVPPDFFDIIEDAHFKGANIIGFHQRPSRSTWVSWLEQKVQALAGMKLPATNIWILGGMMGGNTFLRYQLEKIGGYNENLYNGEDTDLCLRLQHHFPCRNYISMHPPIIHNHAYDWSYLIGRVWARLVQKRMPKRWPTLKLLPYLPKAIYNLITKTITYRRIIRHDQWTPAKS